MQSERSVIGLVFKEQITNSIWLFIVLFWGFAAVVRTLIAGADNYLSGSEASQISAIFLIFLSCLCFKTLEKSEIDSTSYSLSKIDRNQFNIAFQQSDLYLNTAQARMIELQNYHIISQEYVFPFPYLCQIYHLLNLKHLEKVHVFSLNRLKVINVSEMRLTPIGGAIKFQTILGSSVNTLRIWRKPRVEVDLILHSPYTIELNIPVYNDRKIVVIFNVFPLQDNEHKLFIDIYSNLAWPKPILQILLHMASCLTVFEDFPYLQKLAESNLSRLAHLSRIPDHKTMQLFKRFTELYGSTLQEVELQKV